MTQCVTQVTGAVLCMLRMCPWSWWLAGSGSGVTSQGTLSFTGSDTSPASWRLSLSYLFSQPFSGFPTTLTRHPAPFPGFLCSVEVSTRLSTQWADQLQNNLSSSQCILGFLMLRLSSFLILFIFPPSHWPKVSNQHPLLHTHIYINLFSSDQFVKSGQQGRDEIGWMCRCHINASSLARTAIFSLDSKTVQDCTLNVVILE